MTAWRAGRVANLEFNQFHPTALYHPRGAQFPLNGELLRGEGAHLKRPDGTRFMPDSDERGELAPRDIVARAIDHEMKRLGVDCMFLDISHKPEAFVRQHFPMIYEKLLGLGIDLTKDPVAGRPRHALHLRRRGMVDDNGRTDVDRLIRHRRSQLYRAAPAPIAWPRTRCWSVWSTVGPPRRISPGACRWLRRSPPCRRGMKVRWRSRMNWWLSSITGNELRLLVGLCRHCAHNAQTGARPAAHHHAPAGAG